MATDDTTLFESAQAIFCSLADYLGTNKAKEVLDIKKFPTFPDFLASNNNNASGPKYKNNNQQLLKTALTRVNVDVDPKLVYNFLSTGKKGEGWYKSSILIAMAIVTQLKNIKVKGNTFANFNIAKSGYEAGKMFYLRGDKDVMSSIGELFKIANKSEPTKLLITEGKAVRFKDINKWSPADIYFANKFGKLAIAKELNKARSEFRSYEFSDLNGLIADQINLGQLLPLSLKKTTSAVKIELVNFDPKLKDTLLRQVKFSKETVADRTTDWKKYERAGGVNKSYLESWKAYKESTIKTNARGLRFNIRVGKAEGQIQIRHDPSGSVNGRLVVEFIGGGADARGGSVGSAEIFHDIWATMDQTAATKFLTDYRKAILNFSKIKKSYELEKVNLRKSGIYRGITQYDHYMAIASAEQVSNKIMPHIKKWFRNNKNSEKTIKLMFRYVTSREPRSSKFVIAK